MVTRNIVLGTRMPTRYCALPSGTRNGTSNVRPEYFQSKSRKTMGKITIVDKINIITIMRY